MKAATAAYRGHCQRHFISIHAAREGGDSGFRAAPEMVGISIHAAREGGDKVKKVENTKGNNFNPRRP